MSDPKFYDIRFTNKQMMVYNRAVHHILELSDKPSFYDGIRDANPGYRGSDDAIKKEVLDPIIQSLGKLKLSKRPPKTDAKKVTNFNKHVAITPVINHMIATIRKRDREHDITQYYVGENMTDSSKVRKLIRNYLTQENCHRDDKWVLTGRIKDAIPDLIADMKEKGKMEPDGTILQAHLNSCLIRISYQLCK